MTVPSRAFEQPSSMEGAVSRYEVPGMTKIPQDKMNSCWYASAQMLIKWRQDQAQQSLGWLVPPELDADCKLLHDGNGKILNPQILPMAKRLGLKSVPPVCMTPERMERLLRSYGPLWVNGVSHIVVIAGIDTKAQMLKVYDPEPIGIGRIEWRSYIGWYEFGNTPSTMDTGPDVTAALLYIPH
jgi:hypothetical protein